MVLFTRGRSGCNTQTLVNGCWARLFIIIVLVTTGNGEMMKILKEREHPRQTVARIHRGQELGASYASSTSWQVTVLAS